MIHSGISRVESAVTLQSWQAEERAKSVSTQTKLRGLYVITDTHLIRRARFVETVAAAVRGGATMVQLREKETPPEEVIRLGREILAVTRRYGALLIVNDHPAVAREIGADGVHIGRDDPPIAEARAMVGPHAIIGASCYGEVTRAVVAEQAGADYVAFGTPFPSPTKPKRTDISLGIRKPGNAYAYRSLPLAASRSPMHARSSMPEPMASP